MLDYSRLHRYTPAMNRLPLDRRAQIIGLLAEGNSLRATSRLADVSINTVTKLLLDVGAACEEYQDKTVRGLKSKRIQCDEIWAFVYAKAKNLPEQYKGAAGYGAGRGFQAHRVVGGRTPRWLHGVRVHPRSRRPARYARPTDHGRPQGLP